MFRWIKSAQKFVELGENLRNIPRVVRKATAEMFHEADLHGRFVDERPEFGPDYKIAI